MVMPKYTSTVPQSRGRAADRVSHSGMRGIACSSSMARWITMSMVPPK